VHKAGLICLFLEGVAPCIEQTVGHVFSADEVGNERGYVVEMKDDTLAESYEMAPGQKVRLVSTYDAQQDHYGEPFVLVEYCVVLASGPALLRTLLYSASCMPGHFRFSVNFSWWACCFLTAWATFAPSHGDKTTHA
jgi:hypothetical protein